MTNDPTSPGGAGRRKPPMGLIVAGLVLSVIAVGLACAAWAAKSGTAHTLFAIAAVGFGFGLIVTLQCASVLLPSRTEQFLASAGFSYVTIVVVAVFMTGPGWAAFLFPIPFAPVLAGAMVFRPSPSWLKRWIQGHD